MAGSNKKNIIDLIVDSGFLDEKFYLENYPDVELSEMSALEHFINFGIPLNRQPNRSFDPSLYYELNPDVKDASFNASLHYLFHGKKEGRQTSKFLGGTFDSPKDRTVLNDSLVIHASFTEEPRRIVCILNKEKYYLNSFKTVRNWWDNSISFKIQHEFDLKTLPAKIEVELIAIYGDVQRESLGKKTFWNDSVKPFKYSVYPYDCRLWNAKIDEIDSVIFCFNKDYNLDQITILQKGTELSIHHLNDNQIYVDEFESDSPFFVYGGENKDVFLFYKSLDSENDEKKFSLSHSNYVDNQLKIYKKSRDFALYFNGKEIDSGKTANVSIDTNIYSSASMVNVIQIYNEKKLVEEKRLANLRFSQNTPIYMFDGCADTNNQNDISKILLIREKPAPTDHLYLVDPLEYLSNLFEVQLHVVDFQGNESNSINELTEVGLENALVVISRYVTDDILFLLTDNKDSLYKLVYLMDDDPLAAIQTENLPLDYRNRIHEKAIKHFLPLVNLSDVFLVTSEHLVKRYPLQKTRLIHPSFNHESTLHKVYKNTIVKISYHATGGHKNDLDFIAPALDLLTQNYPHVEIDILVGGYCPELLKNNPSVRIHKNMTWDQYSDFCKYECSSIGLAPLLSTPYNLAKSCIKYLDIAALGAVGVYSNNETYQKHIENGVNGILVENDVRAWYLMLEQLVLNPTLLINLREESVRQAEQLFERSLNRNLWEEIV